MVANGRNIVISCFEAHALVFFARASRTSSPNKRFENPFQAQEKIIDSVQTEELPAGTQKTNAY